MRYKSKVDRNQAEIVKALRGVGATVLHCHSLKNAFDILVGFKGVNFIMEIKDGELPPSKKKLTPGEQGFKDTWRGGKYYIVENIDQALKVIGI